MRLTNFGEGRRIFHLARKTVRLQSIFAFFGFGQGTILEIEPRLYAGLAKTEIRPPPAGGKRYGEIDLLPTPIDGHPDLCGFPIYFIVPVLQIAEGPDGRAIYAGNAVSGLYTGRQR